MNKVHGSVRMLGFFATLLCWVLISQNSASATNLNVSLSCNHPATVFPYQECSYQFFNFGPSGGEAYGSASFEPVAPGWSVDFRMANEIVWCDEFSNHGFDCFGSRSQYLYGTGGSFSMTAPVTCFSPVSSPEAGQVMKRMVNFSVANSISSATGAMVYPPPVSIDFSNQITRVHSAQPQH